MISRAGSIVLAPTDRSGIGTVAVPTSRVVESLRAVKDEGERDAIRKAAAIADRAFERILEELRPGRTEREIALRLEFMMREMGADGASFDIIVASGPRSALPHGVASDRVLEKGDLVTLDFGASYRGYCSDITRTVVLGEPNDAQRRIYETVREAQQAAVDAIRPGMTGKEADRVARDRIKASGYEKYFGHGTGHGLGMEVHEAPRLSPRGEEILEPGMVVTVEPGIYLPEFGGVRIEDDVIVTEDGREVLTQSPKHLPRPWPAFGSSMPDTGKRAGTRFSCSIGSDGGMLKKVAGWAGSGSAAN